MNFSFLNKLFKRLDCQKLTISVPWPESFYVVTCTVSEVQELSRPLFKKANNYICNIWSISQAVFSL